jgi:large subunit ribosomal protein L13
MDTIFVNPKNFDRKWYVVDAAGQNLGRVAAKVAYVLRGKNKPYYTPHQECGDYVIIINAEKITVTGGKEDKKIYYRHSRRPGGLSQYTLKEMLQRRPEYPLEMAVRGMLPKTRLGRTIFTNLKVYTGPSHPHNAQQPLVLEI